VLAVGVPPCPPQAMNRMDANIRKILKIDILLRTLTPPYENIETTASKVRSNIALKSIRVNRSAILLPRYKGMIFCP